MIPVELATKILNQALRNGADLAELYLEDRQSLNLALDDGKLETAVRGQDRGGGVRVFYGNTAAYAFTDDLSEEALLSAAHSAAAAAKGERQTRIAIDLTQRTSHLVFPMRKPFDGLTETDKAQLLHRMDQAARGYDPRVRQVQASYGQLRRRMWLFNSDGVWAEDERNIIEMRVAVTAQQNGIIQRIGAGIGGQTGLELFEEHNPVDATLDIATSAVKMLDARPAPAGEMTVIITNGWGGVLFHEACGHALEADFVSKGTSAYTGLQGHQIANPIVTAIDDGTIPGRRGSLRFDDEGTPSSRTVLIENGILKEYMWDLTEARRMGRESTGNGRRQSFRHMPMPRMTNTYIDVGPYDPEEIIRSVQKGLFVKRLGGGQADPAKGDFVFSVTEGYLIEDGVLTAPVRGATLIGNGPEVLKRIDMVGTDLALDQGMGTCGKFQNARVSVGQPTVRIPQLTVGGTDRSNDGPVGE
jgi:TldD protein